MKDKSLSKTNRYLKQPNNYASIVNVATSTAIETGKPSSVYIKLLYSKQAIKNQYGQLNNCYTPSFLLSRVHGYS